MQRVESSHHVPAKVREKYPDAFLLKVKGEPMNRIPPNGSYALIDPDQKADCNGAPYAVCVNGYDATITRARRLNDGFELAPDSRATHVFDAGILDGYRSGRRTYVAEASIAARKASQRRGKAETRESHRGPGREKAPRLSVATLARGLEHCTTFVVIPKEIGSLSRTRV